MPAAKTDKTTALVDSPLFVSADFTSTVQVGSTIRITATCSRPIRDGDDPGIDILSSDPDISGFVAFGSDLTLEGDGMFVEWTVPAAQPPGEYFVRLFCDGVTDVITPGEVFPPEARSEPLPLQVVAAPAPTTVDASTDLPETD